MIVRKPLVKICGITRSEDAIAAADLGAAFLGFVFAPSSPRCIDPFVAKAIAATVRGYQKQKNDARAVAGRCAPSRVQQTRFVGVFVDERPDVIRDINSIVGLDFAQLHGNETDEFIRQLALPAIKAVRVNGAAPEVAHPSAEWILFDTFSGSAGGGTGHSFDWSLLPRDLSRQFFLAGGLRAENVAAAVRQARPHAIDVSSGVEVRAGVKDAAKLKALFQELDSL